MTLIEAGGLAGATYAIIRLGEWFIQGQLARVKKDIGNGDGSNGNGKGSFGEEDRKTVADILERLKNFGEFSPEDARRLMEAAKNSWVLIDQIKQIFDALLRSDKDGVLLIYRPPQWEETMAGLLLTLKEISNNTKETTNQIERIALIQQQTMKNQDRLEQKLTEHDSRRR